MKPTNKPQVLVDYIVTLEGRKYKQKDTTPYNAMIAVLNRKGVRFKDVKVKVEPAPAETSNPAPMGLVGALAA